MDANAEPRFGSNQNGLIANPSWSFPGRDPSRLREVHDLLEETATSLTVHVDNSLLVQSLRQLIREIAQIPHVPAICGTTDSPLRRWEDGDYVYLELDCPGTAAVEADISVLFGRVFARIGRCED